ncbi:MAG: nitroreductase family protein [Methanobrevibacter sp.]|nr:nitroreductase family protein [Methanobrevibacter sp.]
MNPILIDDEKCIACSSCINDCPNSFIYMEDGKIQTYDKGCMECGHCYAICPEGAIKMANYDFSDEMVVSMTEINEDTLLNAMKSRRTIRQFKPIEVEDEKINMILEAGRYAPTGANSQDVKYTILGSKQAEAEEICVNLFRKGKKVGNISSYLRRIEVTDNFFFKGAPLVIVVSSKSNINAGLASAYMEIMANSLGLGVLYSGFFVMCTKLSRKLRNLIELEKGHEVVSCMVIGYPKVKYQRIVPRKDLQVNRL